MASSEELIPLFEINPNLDRKAIAKEFARDGRVQVRDVLTEQTAKEVLKVLTHQTKWGLSWQADHDGPHHWRPEQLATFGPQQSTAMGEKLKQAMQQGEYAFIYAGYPLVDAYVQKWDANSPVELILEHVNEEPFLGLMRDITGIKELVKADAQATLFRPGHFLSQHNDSHKAEGWRIAYVLNFTPVDWRPDWGGYLLFYNEEGDVVAGYKPRFNSLNMFAVPRLHSVSYVPPFVQAPRLAITGWVRDR